MAWICPEHGKVTVVACATEGPVCLEDVSGRGPESHESYVPCDKVCSDTGQQGSTVEWDAPLRQR